MDYGVGYMNGAGDQGQPVSYDPWGNALDANGNIIPTNGGAGAVGYDYSPTPTSAPQQALPNFLSSGSQFSMNGVPLPGLTPEQLQFAYGGGAQAAQQQAAPQAEAPAPVGPVGGTGNYSGLLAPYSGGAAPSNQGSLVDLGGPSGVPYVPQMPTFTPPTFHPPSYKPPPEFKYDPFQAPTWQQAAGEPGYQFAEKQGFDDLQRAAAARGTLNDSGTLKGLINYGQNAASQQYQNVFNRAAGIYGMNRQNAVDAYNMNYGTQYKDPYQFDYQAAIDAFAPQMEGFKANVQGGLQNYNTLAAAGQHQSDQNASNAWNQWLANWEVFKDNRDSTFNKLMSYAQA